MWKFAASSAPETPFRGWLIAPPDAVAPIEHPAAKAWSRLSAANPIPESVDTLSAPCDRRPTRPSVYRLNGVAHGGGSVVAKWAPRRNVAVERTVYEKVLPHASVPSLRYYGTVRESDGDHSWLFVEDAGAQAYRNSVPEHRALASEWFGQLHVSTALLGHAPPLSRRGLDRHRARWRRLAAGIRCCLGDSRRGAEDAPLLEALLGHCRAVGACWGEIEHLCAALPDCVVHGDFTPHNARVRIEANGPTLYAFDWESAGWGTPAEDLAGLEAMRYWAVVRHAWPWLDLGTVIRLEAVGSILRCLTVLCRVITRLDDRPVASVAESLQIYEKRLASARREAGLGG